MIRRRGTRPSGCSWTALARSGPSSRWTRRTSRRSSPSARGSRGCRSRSSSRPRRFGSFPQLRSTSGSPARPPRPPPPTPARPPDPRTPPLAPRHADGPERQRTLDAAVSWSYDLLDDEPKLLLRRLAVFAGGAGFDEIERATAGVPGIPDAYEALSTLIDRSLVQPVGTDRFAMLETIRAFAASRLGEATGRPAR